MAAFSGDWVYQRGVANWTLEIVVGGGEVGKGAEIKG